MESRGGARRNWVGNRHRLELGISVTEDSHRYVRADTMAQEIFPYP